MVAVTAVAALALVACAPDDDTADSTTTTTAATGAVVGVAGADDAEWPQSSHDLANSRTNPTETAVTAETVGALTERWSLDGVRGVTSTPTVVDGVAYFGDWAGNARAVEPETGEEIWTTALGGAVIPSLPVDGEAVFAASGRTLYRLDRATGEVEWEREVHDHPFAMISASPVVADGLVLQGVASGELTVAQPDYGFRGAIAAYDAETGEPAWRFDTTPGDETAGAGVGIWSTPAVDPERGVLYVGTGNTYEEPASPLADALLALELETGRQVWATQFTETDVFSAGNPFGSDADVGVAPNLWTVDGRDFVGAADKAGVYHALDRETGAVVWTAELTPGSYLGGAIGSAAFVDGRLIVTSNVGNAENNAPGSTAEVFGLDPATGDQQWAVEVEGTVFAPVSAVPGVAFVGTTTNRMLALDTATGDELWRLEVPNQVGSGPAVHEGTVLWGYGFALFEGPGEGGLIALGVDG
jgi:polyvinyl alcohol dehydrogenase (cytochrome)